MIRYVVHSRHPLHDDVERATVTHEPAVAAHLAHARGGMVAVKAGADTLFVQRRGHETETAGVLREAVAALAATAGDAA